MTDTTPMTKEGYDKLQEELEHLKKEERPKIIQAIAEARAFGDLKENAEYHAAREQQSFIEGRIQLLEGKLSTCRVIDVTELENNGTVVFGSTVTLENLDDETTVTYQIVGDEESDLKQLKISVHSPIARAIIGKKVDEEVDVQIPAGLVSYAIIKVEYL